jgi:hypothetical protein
MRRHIRDNSLWLVGIGLMIASSGIDGAYMALWMQDLPGIGGAAILGYILNTTADIAGLVIIYWFGRLQMDRSSTKRRLSYVLLGAEVIAIAFAWFFGWRQLRMVLPSVEGANTEWVAPISAGFIPLLLAFVGYAQSLLAGRIESDARAARESQSDAERAPSVRTETHAATQSDPHAGSNGHDSYACPHCLRGGFASPQALSAHLRFCDAYQAQKEEEAP